MFPLKQIDKKRRLSVSEVKMFFDLTNKGKPKLEHKFFKKHRYRIHALVQIEMALPHPFVQFTTV